jgi:hypothetical protein
MVETGTATDIAELALPPTTSRSLFRSRWSQQHLSTHRSTHLREGAGRQRLSARAVSGSASISVRHPVALPVEACPASFEGGQADSLPGLTRGALLAR